MQCLGQTSDQSVIKQLPKIFFERPLHGVSLCARYSSECEQKARALEKNGFQQGRSQRQAAYRFSLPVEVVEHASAINDKPTWSLLDKGLRYQSLVQLFEQKNTPSQQTQLLTICCEGNGCFEYSRSGIKICWQKQGTGPEHYFQSLGLGFWLERRGIPCIHANAVAIGDGAIGILAPSQTGKTTITASLLQQVLPDSDKNGAALMTDDMIAIHHVNCEYHVYPAWPLFRAWPDTIMKIIDTDAQSLPRVHDRFDKRLLNIEKSTAFNFCRSPRRLKTLYLLDRRKKGDNTCHKKIDIKAIKPASALVHLVQNSMLGDAYKAMGIESKRLETLAKLLEKVPLKKVSFESGMEHLPQISRAITEDAS